MVLLSNIQIHTTFNNYFLILLISQAVLLSIILLASDSIRNKSKRILSSYFIAYAISHIIIFLFKNHLNDLAYIENFLIFYYTTFSLTPVLFYFYIFSINNEKLKVRHAIKNLIAPVAIFFLLIIWFTPMSAENKQIIINNIFISEQPINDNLWVFVAEFIIMIQVFTYIILIFFKIRQNRHLIEEHYSYNESLSLNWVFYLFYIFFISYFLFFIFGNVTNFHIDDTTQSIYLISQIITILIIGIYGLKQKPLYINDSNNGINDVSHLNIENKAEIIEMLKSTMTDKKPYLDNSLRIDYLARELNTNRYYLSLIIKEISGLNFCNYINKHRVEEFISKFENEDVQSFSIEGIANDVGFKSKSSFYAAFRKFKEHTPIQFMLSKRLQHNQK